MAFQPFSPRMNLVMEARNRLDRIGAAAILREDLENGPPTGDVWRIVSQAATQLGESGLAMEAARRVAAGAPADLDAAMFYGLVLARNLRFPEALAQMDALPESLQSHPAVLHFRAVQLTQMGDFAQAERLLRRAIAISPAPVQWIALSVAKTFKPGDPDIAHMESVLPRVGRAPPAVRAELYYALGKAYDDIKEPAKAAAAYGVGAQLMRSVANLPDGSAWNKFIAHLLRGYTPEAMGRLKPSGADGSNILFVTGFPRSGTTLVEQILTSHTHVTDGSELNLIPVALTPASHMSPQDYAETMTSAEATDYLNEGDFTFDDAMAYQDRWDSADPWGDVGRDFLHMVAERMGVGAKVVDKTLNLGSFMGLTLHSLPGAKVFWLRRRPEDCALSNYRLYSREGTLPWTYAPEDIAAFFKAEDQMYAHWSKMFPDRIMTLPYEELVSDPQTWIRRILAHAGLSEEPQVFEPHKSTRAVSTASMAQVRSPISTKRIGSSEAYADFTRAFRKAYYG